MKGTLVLFGLLGSLLFLAPPAFGDTRTSVVDTEGGPADVKIHHVESNTPVSVERIFESGGKVYAAAAPKPFVTIVIVPNDAIKYETWKTEKTFVTRPVDAPVIAHVRNRNGSWTVYADGKTYHRFESRGRAMAKAWVAVMDRIDALEDVPDTGGPPLGTMALAGLALLTGGSIFLRRIVSW
jgi:hypothetical protein